MNFSNLNEISNFIKNNQSFSDFNNVNNLFLNLNYTNLKTNTNLKSNNIFQSGGLGLSDLAKTALEQAKQQGTQFATQAGTQFANQLSDQLSNQLSEQLNNQLNNQLSNLQGEVQNTQLNTDQNTVDNTQNQLDFQNTEQPIITDSINDQMDNPMVNQMDNQMVNPMDNQMVNPMGKIQTLPDMYLQNPGFTSDYVNTYTIKEGTILYHATTNKKGFNTNFLELGKDKLISFFTPNFRLASDKIEGCSVDKQNGYIHVFMVKKDIPNIYIKLPYDIADDINSGILANEFCSQNHNYFGIGFFYPKNNIEVFSNQIPNQIPNQINEENYYSEFGLCNPRPYLEYLYSQRCQSLRKLSDPFRFD